MDNDMFRNENCHLYHYYDHDNSPPDYQSSCRPYLFSHLLYPSTTNLSPAFNASMATTTLDSGGTNDEYNPLINVGDLSSILWLRSLQHSVLPSASSSSSFTTTSRFRYSHSNSPPLKMEFNEDVLVMDGILLNQMPSGRSSRHSLLGGSSSSSSSSIGSCYGTGSGGICKPPPLNHQMWKKIFPPCLVSARSKGRVSDPRDQIPKDIADSHNLWACFNRAQGINSTPPSARNGTEAGENSITTDDAEVTPTVSNSAGGGGDTKTENSNAANIDSSSAATTSEQMASSSNAQYVKSNEQEADFIEGNNQSSMHGRQSPIEHGRKVVQNGQNTTAAKGGTSTLIDNTTNSVAMSSPEFSSCSVKTKLQPTSPSDGQAPKIEALEPFSVHEIEVEKKGKTIVWNENVPCTAARYGLRLSVFEMLSGRNVDGELNKKVNN